MYHQVLTLLRVVDSTRDHSNQVGLNIQHTHHTVLKPHVRRVQVTQPIYTQLSVPVLHNNNVHVLTTVHIRVINSPPNSHITTFSPRLTTFTRYQLRVRCGRHLNRIVLPSSFSSASISRRGQPVPATWTPVGNTPSDQVKARQNDSLSSCQNATFLISTSTFTLLLTCVD